MANETTTSTADDMLSPGEVLPFVMSFNHPVLIADAVAWTFSAPKGSVAVRIPADGSMTVPAGTVNEATDLTRVAYSTDSESITPAVVGLELAITDQIERGSVAGSVSARALAMAMNRLAARRDSDLLAVIASASNTTGAGTDELTRVRAKLAINLAQAQFGVNGQQIAFLLPPSGYDSLSVDELTTTATSATLAAQFGPQSGFIGHWHGANLFRAPQAPASSPGYWGALTPIGEGVSGLAVAQVERINAEFNRGAEGARMRASFIALSSWYGVGISKEANLLAVEMA